MDGECPGDGGGRGGVGGGGGAYMHLHAIAKTGRPDKRGRSR